MTTGEFTQSGQQATEDQGATSQLAGHAQQQAQRVGDQAQEKVHEVATEAKGKLRQQLDHRSSQAASQINQQASDLHAVSESLREQGKDGPARAADRLAEYVQKVGGYLSEKDSAALLSDAEDLGRRQPLAVGAGALALGFAASRFLKASSRSRYSSRPRPSQPASGPSVPAAPFPPAPAGAPPIPVTQPRVPSEPAVPDHSGLGADPIAAAPAVPSGPGLE